MRNLHGELTTVLVLLAGAYVAAVGMSYAEPAGHANSTAVMQSSGNEASCPDGVCQNRPPRDQEESVGSSLLAELSRPGRH